MVKMNTIHLLLALLEWC